MRKSIHALMIPALLVLMALGGGGCSKKARESRYLAKADKYRRAGNYDGAEIEYINVIRLDRSNAKAYAQLGMIAYEQGRQGRAYQFLSKAIQLDPNDLDSHVRLALLYLAFGKQKEARNEAVYVLERRPQDPDAPLVLADCVVNVLDVDTARQRLRSLQLPPGQRAPSAVALGNLDFRMQDVKAAEAEFERAKTDDPKFAPTYGMLGNLYWSQKDLKRADEALKMSADLSPMRSPRRLRYAAFKLQTGDSAAARQVLEDILAKAPDFVSASITLAQLSATEKKFDDALELTKGVITRDPDNFEAMLLSGRINLARGKPDLAISDFEKMAKAYAKSPQVLYQLALAYNESGDTAKAIATLNDTLTLNPSFTDATIALAQLRITKGDINPAIISLRQLIQQRPDLPQAQLVLGDAYCQQGNLDDALRVYRQLEADYPKNPQTPVIIGRILEVQRRLDEARSEFNKSLSIAPDNVTALEQLITLDVNQGQYSNAFAQLQQHEEQNPKEQAVQLLFAKVYLAQGDTNKAEASLLKEAELRPDSPIPYLLLNELYLRENDTHKAMDILDRLLARDPKNVEALTRKGLLHMVKEDSAAARDDYEQVLALDPKSSTALNNLAYLYSEKLGNLDRAYDMARRARDLAPLDPDTADTLGWVLYQRGDFAQALSLEQESASKLRANPEVQLHLGQANYMMGSEDAARASLQYAVQSKQDFPGKDEAASCLQVLAVDVKSAGADARALLEKRVAKNPNDPVALSRLAALYKRDGDTAKAIETYEAAYKANPKDVRVLVELARLYLNRPDQADRAFTLAKAAYALAPDDSGVTRVLGRAAFLGGDYKWSLTLLQQAAQKQPGDPDLQYDLAEAAYSRGQITDAQASARSALQSTNFSRAADARRFLDTIALSADPAQATAAAGQIEQLLKSQPGFVPALMAQGLIYEQKPDASAAMQTFEKVLSLYPDFVPAKRELAVLYAQAQVDLNKAYGIASEARQAYPDDPEIAKALGIIAYRQGDYAKAARFLNEAALRKSEDGQVICYLGLAQYQLKQRADSKKNLSHAIGLKLPDDLVQQARHALAELK